MNCIGPIVPDDADLLAYADLQRADLLPAGDAASLAIREHVARCVACQVRAQTLAREARSFARLLRRAGCPPSLELGEFHLKLLGEYRAATIARHLTYCRACRAELGDLATFMERVRRPVVDATQDAFSALRTIAARLCAGSFDGRAPVRAPALRGVSTAEHAPLVYSAEDILVTVDSWTDRPGQPGRVVAGLVVGPLAFAGAEAILDGAADASTAPIDDLGNFLFAEVSPNTYHLMIRLPATGVQIEINELPVK